MRAVWLTLLLLVPMSGCFDFLDPALDDGPTAEVAEVPDAPDSYTVSDVAVWPRSTQEDYTVASIDGVPLSVKIYEPITRDAREDGSPIQFPVMILVHPWGFEKEYFENAPMGEPSEDDPDPRVNIMQMFAERGFITVAYDVRGFGRSGGEVNAVAAIDMADLEAIRQHIGAGGPSALNLNVNGFYGIGGMSLGGGTSLRALATNPEFDTAISIYGWADLYEGIVPGNVPKSVWPGFLFGLGEAGSGGQVSEEVESWFAKLLQRVDMAGVEASMDARSTHKLLPQVDKPILLCQGLEETLFPQIDRLWGLAGGFTRSIIFTGGHSTQDPTCWDRALDWMDFFTRGVKNDVPEWPFLQTVDALPDGPELTYSRAALANVDTDAYYFHEDALVRGPSERTFTIQQRVASNPFGEPAAVYDSFGGQALPEQFRQDPTAVFFESEPMETTKVILGAPKVNMELTAEDAGADFQVVATLFVVEDGRSTIISRGSYSHKADVTPEIDREFTLDMTWVKATVPADAVLVLKLGGNDSGHYMPFPNNYAVDFTGSSGLHLPVFA